jgi:protein-disulfide isomerase
MALLGAPLSAQEMADAERDAFRAEVRAYLLENQEGPMDAIAVLETRREAAEAQSDQMLLSTYNDALFSDGHSYVGGNPEGDITIVEFMDYRCGYCKRAFPEVAELVENDGNIRYIIKELPILGEQSVLAARYAMSVKNIAGDDAYKTIHDTLMAFRGDVTDASLSELSDIFGYDHAAIQSEMSSEAVTTTLAENQRLAQQLNITGTPSFVFADQMLRGYVPLADMQALVRAHRENAG